MNDDRALRATSPEFCEDYERQRASRYHSPSTKKDDERLAEIRQAGRDAAWCAYPRRAVNPHRSDTVEFNEWQFGADGSYEWAAIHVEEDWFRVVDGREVRP